MSLGRFDEPVLLRSRKRFTCNENVDGAALAVRQFVVVDIAVVQILVLLDERFDIDAETVLTDHHECGPDTWHDHEDYDDGHDGLGLLCSAAVTELHFLEFQVLDHDVGREDDEYAVYGEQVERSEEICDVA